MILLLDTAPTASNFVDFLPNYVVAARRELSVPKSVKEPTGPAKETGSVTSTGAVVTFQTKDSESEPRYTYSCWLENHCRTSFLFS